MQSHHKIHLSLNTAVQKVHSTKKLHRFFVVQLNLGILCDLVYLVSDVLTLYLVPISIKCKIVLPK